MRSKCGLTPSAAHINGVKPNQSGSISWVPLALKRKTPVLQKKDRHPTLLECFIFYFLPSCVCIRACLSIPRFCFKRCWLNREYSWSTVSRVGVKQMDVSSYQNISTVDHLSCLLQNSSPISSCLGVSLWFLAAFFRGGAHLERARPTACLGVSAEQSQLRTERSGGGMTPVQSCRLGLKWEEQRGWVRGRETGNKQTGHLLTGSSVEMWLTVSEGCASPPGTWPLPASNMRWQHIFPVFRLLLLAAEYSRTMPGFDHHLITIHLPYEGVKKKNLFRLNWTHQKLFFLFSANSLAWELFLFCNDLHSVCCVRPSSSMYLYLCSLPLWISRLHSFWTGNRLRSKMDSFNCCPQHF